MEVSIDVLCVGGIKNSAERLRRLARSEERRVGKECA